MAKSNESSHSEPASAGRPPVDAAGATTPPPPPPGYQPVAAPPRKGGVVWRIICVFLLLLLLVSITANVWMGDFLMVLLTGPSEATYQTGDSDNRIVILPIEGMITGQTETFVRRSLDTLRDDPPAAIVLRVDSGGGAVGASDRIYNLLRKYREDMKKEHQRDVPIIASFGTVAASGGYYVSMAADEIYAENTTITGSIGVMAPTFSVGGLLQKIGVDAELLEAPGSPHKDIANNPLRPLNDKDRDKYDHVLDLAHQRFIEVVKTGRKMNDDQLAEVTKGDTFMAQSAKDHHLVDKIGYIDEAIAAAAKAGGVTGKPRVKMMRAAPKFSAFSMLGMHFPSASAENISGRQVHDWMLEMQSPHVMYWSGLSG